MISTASKGETVSFRIGRATYEGRVVSASKDGKKVEVEFEDKSGQARTKVIDSEKLV